MCAKAKTYQITKQMTSQSTRAFECLLLMRGYLFRPSLTKIGTPQRQKNYQS